MRCFAWQAWAPGPKLQMAPVLTTIRVEDGQNWRHSQTAFPRDFLKALLGMIALAKPHVSKISKARAANRASQAEARRALGRAKIANGAGFDHSFANHGQNRRHLQTRFCKVLSLAALWAKLMRSQARLHRKAARVRTQ